MFEFHKAQPYYAKTLAKVPCKFLFENGKFQAVFKS